MKRLIGILQFMTRIPIPIDTGFDEDFHKGIIYFPIVGLILGLCYYVLGVLSSILFNDYITTIVILTGAVILTGGLHLDGLGDTFDGLYSYKDQARILEIMKDSRLGTNGLLAIMILLLFKVGFIYQLIGMDALWVIILMPVVARTMQVWACYKTRTPRANGMGNIFIGKVSTATLVGAYGLLIAIGLVIISIVLLRSQCIQAIYVMGGKFIVSILILTLCNQCFIRSVYKKIEGITGDILGCICELAELGFLVFWILMA